MTKVNSFQRCVYVTLRGVYLLPNQLTALKKLKEVLIVFLTLRCISVYIVLIQKRIRRTLFNLGYATVKTQFMHDFLFSVLLF